MRSINKHGEAVKPGASLACRCEEGATQQRRREAAWLLLSWRVGPLADREGGYCRPRRQPARPGVGEGRGWRVWHSRTTTPHCRHAAATNVLARHDYHPVHPPTTRRQTADGWRSKASLLSPRPRSPQLHRCHSIKTTGIDSRSEQPMTTAP